MKKHKFDLFVFQFVVLIFALTISVVLLSCKSDTSTGPSTGNPPLTNDSLLFEKDSLVLRSNGVDSLHFYYLGIPPLDSCRIEFTGLTNIDSGKGIFSVSLWVIDDSIQFIGQNYVLIFSSFGANNFNRFHNYGFPAYFNPFFVRFYLMIHNSFSVESKFISITNIKIYKIRN